MFILEILFSQSDVWFNLLIKLLIFDCTMINQEDVDNLFYTVLTLDGSIEGFLDKVFDFIYRRTDFFESKSPQSEISEAERVIKSLFLKYTEIQKINDTIEELSEEEVDAEPPDYVIEETVITSNDVVLEETGESDINNYYPGPVDWNEIVKTNKKRDTGAHEMDPDSYNGARYEDYCWSQTLKDIDVRLLVPKSVNGGKQVRVHITQDRVQADVKINDLWNVLKEDEFARKVNVEESTWTLVPGEYIHICLQKLTEKWWDCCFVNEPKIDLTRIDTSIKFDELDNDSQVRIQELMYNEHLKQMEKPTSEQARLHNILKGAWNQEDSPFKDQPYDPSIIDTITPAIAKNL